MYRFATLVASFAVFVIYGWSVGQTAAAWSEDPTVNLAVCTADDPQQTSNASAVSDGLGGAIVVWVDDPYGSPDLGAQRVSADGEIMWAGDGVEVCTAAGTQGEIRTVSDGAGGAIIVWRDRRGSDYDYYAQRIDADGVIQWPAGFPPLDGAPVCTIAGDQEDMEAVADGAGGVIVVWRHDDPSVDGVYAQRLDSAGNIMWPTGAPSDTGAIVCDHNYSQSLPALTFDGAGGVVVAWADSRNSATTNSDIYAQRLNGDGVRQWAPDGVPICLEDLGQSRPQLTSDGFGGAIVLFDDPRPLGSDFGIYVQRIDSTGSIRWPAEGVTINETFTSSELDKAVVSDGVGGAYVVWRDRRDIATAGLWDLYAQRSRTWWSLRLVD